MEHFKSPTTGDEIIRSIEIPTPGEDLILRLIAEHDTSKMREGVRYYENESDIRKRKQYTYVDEIKVEDKLKPNNRIPNGWHKLLVDQKASYMVGQPIDFTVEEDPELLLHINELLGEKFDDLANELVINSSNKGVEWLHPFIDEDGEFDYMITPAEEIIVIYENKRQTKIQHVIRYYPVIMGGEEVIQVELWDKQMVTFYAIHEGKLVLDLTEEMNPRSHFYYTVGEQTNGYGWGKVPFIPFKNNEGEIGDLQFYKHQIDAYDSKVSDNQNSFDEVQELIFVLKGYDGENMGEFLRKLKYYKGISVDGEGAGVDTIQAEIPMASIDSHLDRLKEAIYTFGQGVDTSTDSFSSAPSGIALKFLYSLLDMKSDTMERKFRPSLQELIWYICEYLEISGDGHQKHDYKAVKYTFRRSTMSNDYENAQIAQSSKGIISDETIVSNHPWVHDSETEMERLKKEAEDRMKLFEETQFMTDEEGDEDEPEAGGTE